ncbi:hypothetical protein T4B_15094 [Trichinella pseudospiralis]|uniref:Uncharacterized protein n=1 Tax=Trichinella pseudospiralis TaxID=6337 RepID=A0A0V0XMM3_TRIPS|nr:hypothetical protein T4E_1476 [Trichinella pseudospiralis]KRX89213.1 hypothetical protein T4E_147 [Trichinella pseudospiralis]KRZ15464.1 hypothetical protein T4B_15094 [Trichinella pseudospiralis]KRZ35191.1 hypothetical protein T4C_11422 [Trichinella pseudospiralis]
MLSKLTMRRLKISAQKNYRLLNQGGVNEKESKRQLNGWCTRKRLLLPSWDGRQVTYRQQEAKVNLMLEEQQWHDHFGWDEECDFKRQNDTGNAVYDDNKDNCAKVSRLRRWQQHSMKRTIKQVLSQRTLLAG